MQCLHILPDSDEGCEQVALCRSKLRQWRRMKVLQHERDVLASKATCNIASCINLIQLCLRVWGRHIASVLVLEHRIESEVHMDLLSSAMKAWEQRSKRSSSFRCVHQHCCTLLLSRWKSLRLSRTMACWRTVKKALPTLAKQP